MPLKWLDNPSVDLDVLERRTGVRAGAFRPQYGLYYGYAMVGQPIWSVDKKRLG
jgi:hypothetical protein